MGRPLLGARLYKFKHRPNWYIREKGTPDTSTGTPCFGQAVSDLHQRKRHRSDEISTDTAMLKSIRTILRRSKTRAAAKGLEFNLTESDLLKMISRQENLCALSGLPFSVAPSGSGRRMPFTPSLDRIRNGEGYTVENVRIVCAIVNLARGDFTDEELLSMCRGIAERAASKNRFQAQNIPKT